MVRRIVTASDKAQAMQAVRQEQRIALVAAAQSARINLNQAKVVAERANNCVVEAEKRVALTQTALDAHVAASPEPVKAERKPRRIKVGASWEVIVAQNAMRLTRADAKTKPGVEEFEEEDKFEDEDDITRRYAPETLALLDSLGKEWVDEFDMLEKFNVTPETLAVLIEEGLVLTRRGGRHRNNLIRGNIPQ